MPEIKEVVGVVFGAIREYVGFVIDIIKSLIETFSGFFTSTEESSTEFKEFFIKFVEWLKENFRTDERAC